MTVFSFSEVPLLELTLESGEKLGLFMPSRLEAKTLTKKAAWIWDLQPTKIWPVASYRIVWGRHEQKEDWQNLVMKHDTLTVKWEMD